MDRWYIWMGAGAVIVLAAMWLERDLKACCAKCAQKATTCASSGGTT